MNRDEQDTDARITNLIWEAAKLLNPNSYIEPEKVQKAKEELITTLKN